MDTGTLEAYLDEHPLFRGLDSSYVRLLCACASDVQFDVGELIFRQGASADRCFLLRQGMASLEIPSGHSATLQIQTLGQGEVLGWSWLFPPYKWHFDARALEPIRAVALDGRCLRGKCDQDPGLGYELMKRFSSILHERMQAARLQILDLYGPASP